MVILIQCIHRVNAESVYSNVFVCIHCIQLSANRNVCKEGVQVQTAATVTKVTLVPHAS